MNPTDCLEEGQIRPVEVHLVCDVDDSTRAWIELFVHGMTEAWYESVLFGALSYRCDGKVVPPLLVRRKRVHADECVVDEPPGIFGNAQEARASAENARREGALDRVGRAQVREARGDCSWREPMIGESDEHCLEQFRLPCGRFLCQQQPERELSEADLAHEVLGEVLSEQPNAGAVGNSERRGKLGIAVDSDIW